MVQPSPGRTERVIARVALPVPLSGLFDYRMPRPAALGARVRVSFGRRRLIGIVVEHAANASVPEAKLKPVESIVDDHPVLDEHLRELCRWMSGYYLHPLGEVVATALPAALRRGDPPRRVQPSPHWRLSDRGGEVDLESLGRAVRQRAVLKALADGPMSQPELTAESGSDATVLRVLEQKGWIEAQAPERDDPAAVAGPELNQDQRRAVDRIRAGLDRFVALLVDGVTGSGKTEVYLSAMASTVAGGGQVLVLVPEIGLTPQLIRRFERRFGQRVAALHSGLSDAARLDVWVRARSRDLAVVIGTRSALFTPMPALKLIVVDEEHDASFKQQDGLRYSARDCAVKRAQMLDIPVVLGSATPSLETLHNALEGRYAHLHLRTRATGAEMPAAEVIDLRGIDPEDGLAPVVLERMSAHLARNEQILVFLNRRGFAPVLMCHACGWYGQCRRCDARLTFHRHDGSLRCHHCGHRERGPTLCPDCGSSRLHPLGEGTQRLEARLTRQFPRIPVVRVDRDTIRGQRTLHRALDAIHEGDASILLGTQMLAKGHDFPEVTLAVIVNLDQALFSSDFRAPEHAAQLLVQVAGRAGRAAKPGTLLLQTHHPGHALFATVLQSGYQAYAAQLLAERKAARFPPYGHLALVRAEAHDRGVADGFLRQAVERAAVPESVALYGPMPSPMERKSGRYRLQLLAQSSSRGALHGFLAPWIEVLRELPAARKVRWAVDVDPLDGV